MFNTWECCANGTWNSKYIFACEINPYILHGFIYKELYICTCQG